MLFHDLVTIITRNANLSFSKAFISCVATLRKYRQPLVYERAGDVGRTSVLPWTVIPKLFALMW